ncbi:reductive dehalogenase [Dehalococcoides mccartyi]|uniref:reductive dehalogenase n=1 Tax=Dehalococcoides mccartyi TaxID=61435 RepID=UPI0003C8ADE4|nr:reductive dehalogenase [Dehalococcoides mccartyi]AHB14123.1 reductive dehalogenase [Dehalococcoides mccartyi GY50]APH13029.1 hypothetical protein ASJ33_07610 [Dehalococcoides mccartyi]
MSNFHTTFSRRDFIKALGLAGTGMGAASTTPVFHDIDELMAKNSASQKHPWWVKERDYLNPTTEINWDAMERFQAHTLWAHLAPSEVHTNIEDAMGVYQAGIEKDKQGWLNELPGHDCRAQSLYNIGWIHPYSVYTGARGVFLGENILMPQDRGLPIWKGNLDENASMMRALAMECGASQVAFGEIIEGKTKQLINQTTCEYGPEVTIEFEDVDKPYVDVHGDLPSNSNPLYTGKGSRGYFPVGPQGKLVIPNNMRWVIIMTIRQRLDFVRTAPSLIASSDSAKAYDQIQITNYRVKAFLRGIGYYGVGGATFGLTCARPGWATLFGLGELSRMHEAITPEYGPLIRSTIIIPTNLPLPPSNPIDFGANRFCHTCKKCANSCPVNAIYSETDPDFIRTPENAAGGITTAKHLQPTFFNNSPGYKRWPLNHYACAQQWQSIGTDCAICQGNCVFSKEPNALIHEFVKPMIANTKIFNSFFYNMDEAFGYGIVSEEHWDDFWKVTPNVSFNDMHY